MTLSIRRRILIYAVALAFTGAAWLATPHFFRPTVYSIPSSKVAAYLAARSTYSILFVGDSRTYVDIQPRVIDAFTLRRSFNLGSFGLWMPVQYLEFRDVFKSVPRQTVIVWSLSHHNFMPVGDRWWIPGQYAFGLWDCVEYARDGYPLKRIIQEYQESPFSPFDLIATLRKRTLASLQTIIWRRPYATASAAAPPNSLSVAADGQNRTTEIGRPTEELNRAAADRVIDELKRDPNVTLISPVVQGGSINSVEAVRSDGGYERFIIDQAAVREQQRKLWPLHSDSDQPCEFAANPVYMRTFGKILDLISKYHLRVIVNYIEDAPGSWQSDAQRRCAKEFVLHSIVPTLQSRGIAFIAPDFYPRIRYSNDFYFDESHLVSEGAAMYSRLLAIEIDRVVREYKW
jgi:hypothetical protein